MKKFIFNVLALLAVCTAGNAQIAGLNIGYCNGEVSTSIHKEFCSQEKDVWVSGAIWLPASDINVNAGNELKSIRAGLAQKIGIDTMSVWVREPVNGDQGRTTLKHTVHTCHHADVKVTHVKARQA